MATLRYQNGPNQSTLLSVEGAADPAFAKAYPYDLAHDLNQHPISSADDMAALDRFKKAYSDHKSDIEDAARKYFVSPDWLFGIMWAESRGKADLVSTDPRGVRSYGLFQISNPGIRGATSDEDMLDPGTNAGMAAKFIQSLFAGRDFALPQVASMYASGRSNASDNDVQNGVVIVGAKGPPIPVPHAPDAANPWDVAEPRPGFLMDVVRGANTAVALSEETDSTLAWVLGLGAAATVAYFFFRRSRTTVHGERYEPIGKLPELVG
jgi:hypothetical protein